MRTFWLAVPLVVFIAQSAFAGDVSDDPAKVRRIPSAGVPLKPEDRAALEKGIEALGKEIAALKDELKAKPQLLDLLPDVQIYYNAVHYAVKYDEFLNTKEPAKDIALAKKMLDVGMERAKHLREGNAPWTSAPGANPRGYVSKIDGSVQPYVLILPASYSPNMAANYRLDIWYHGRGEDLTELRMLQTTKGEFAPKDAFVLLPYGRYCNANKFAGEVDTFETIDSLKKQYRIDDLRISVRGFSMGGASTWQFATHFPDKWAAANPGAGFSETPEFTHVFDPKNMGPKPTEFEVKLWHLYDSSHYCENLFNLPTVAYSGELDGQKQAADVMAREMKKVGLELTHIIGPGAHHNYEAKAKEEVAKRVDDIVGKGRNPIPKEIRFTTYTLRYNQAFWVTIDGLGEHWTKARIEAKLDDTSITAKTENITELTFNFPPRFAFFQKDVEAKVMIDGQTIQGRKPNADMSWSMHLIQEKGKWILPETGANGGAGLHKRHDLQGPIDDAFMDSFVMVAPTGKALNEKTGAWVTGEMKHAVEHWRRQFRGEARVVNDEQVTDAQIKDCNLVLWGDPSSNTILAKIIDKLPLKWDAKSVVIGANSVDAASQVAVLIFPNPLNPKRYVMLNSGFTYRENEYLNNAKQNAKLPDWALIDVSEPPTSRWPGKVVKADFFDEAWAVKK